MRRSALSCLSGIYMMSVLVAWQLHGNDSFLGSHGQINVWYITLYKILLCVFSTVVLVCIKQKRFYI